MTKNNMLQWWTHGDIYTMTATFKSLGNIAHSDLKHLQHLQKAAVAFVYHHNNIHPTAATVTLTKNSSIIYTQ